MGTATEGVSTPEDFAEPETKIINLPRKGKGGKALSLLIRAVPAVEIIKALDGIPELRKGADAEGTAERTFAQVRELLVQQDAPNRRIAELGIVEPQFWFGKESEPGKAPWGNVHTENAAFAVAQIMDLSGLTGGPAPTPAQAQAAEFRGVAK
jgi:hypothetical protein